MSSSQILSHASNWLSSWCHIISGHSVLTTALWQASVLALTRLQSDVHWLGLRHCLLPSLSPSSQSAELRCQSRSPEPEWGHSGRHPDHHKQGQAWHSDGVIMVSISTQGADDTRFIKKSVSSIVLSFQNTNPFQVQNEYLNTRLLFRNSV